MPEIEDALAGEGEAVGFERGGAELVEDLLDFQLDFADEAFEAAERLADGFGDAAPGEAFQMVAKGAGLHGGGKKMLLDGVVEIAGEAITFFETADLLADGEGVAEIVGHEVEALAELIHFVVAPDGNAGSEAALAPIGGNGAEFFEAAGDAAREAGAKGEAGEGGEQREEEGRGRETDEDFAKGAEPGFSHAHLDFDVAEKLRVRAQDGDGKEEVRQFAGLSPGTAVKGLGGQNPTGDVGRVGCGANQGRAGGVEDTVDAVVGVGDQNNLEAFGFFEVRSGFSQQAFPEPIEVPGGEGCEGFRVAGFLVDFRLVLGEGGGGIEKRGECNGGAEKPGE